MKTYNPTLAAGQEFIVAGGNSFTLIQASFGINVQYLKHDMTDTNETATAVESGYFSRYPYRVEKDGSIAGGFDLVKITNGATPQTIKFGVARDGEGGYNIGASTITGGTIDSVANIVGGTIDLVRKREPSSGQFFTGGGSVGAGSTVAKFSIFNPFGSGKTVIVNSLRIGGTVANGTGALNSYLGQFATAITSKANKLIGGAAPVVTLSAITDSVAYGSVINGGLILPINVMTECIGRNSVGYSLAAGKALMFVGASGYSFRASVEWEEY